MGFFSFIYFYVLIMFILLHLFYVQHFVIFICEKRSTNKLYLLLLTIIQFSSQNYFLGMKILLNGFL